MAESESTGPANPFLSLNSLLAVITLVGGIVLVSHRLSSGRPPKPDVEGTRPLGFQNIEARLWEDPFAAWSKLREAETARRRDRRWTDLVAAVNSQRDSLPQTNVLVLGIMVSGQPYAEDQESRIRERYAVGAALGVGGYKPVTPDHIGLVASPWPSAGELEQWLTDTNSQLGLHWTTNSNSHNYCPAQDTNLCLRVPFEIYEGREFFPTDQHTPTRNVRYGRILLLWLDEEYFEDDPASRLALFRKQIDDALAKKSPFPGPEWAVVGPGLSSTLRSLLQCKPLIQTDPPRPWPDIISQLKQVRLILTTPTAMDEVLMESTNVSPADLDHPRHAVASLLNGKVFLSVTNYTCTDAQLAHEAIAELKLRGVELTNTANRLILISEWDTYFARMSSLAYAAEMLGYTDGVGRLKFMSAIRSAPTNPWPPNLERFVYLRGLDGEAADTKRARNETDKKALADPRNPAGIEQLVAESQDYNKAEGASQFDYLTRMGDEIADMDRCSRMQRPARHVAAVGIIGMDVYDTLLILHALRERLPEAIFFSTRLDARLWQPDELAWSRNLVVLSPYGLRLNDSLQPGVPPFRDSDQSAEYLGTLNAIKNDKLGDLQWIRPGHFEIGRDGPVRLRAATNTPWTDPPETPPPNSICLPLLVALAILLVSNVFIWRAGRALVLWPFEYVCEPLRVSPEDLGQDDDLRTICEELMKRSQDDEFANWMLAHVFSPSFEAGADLVTGVRERLLKVCNTLVFMANPEPQPAGANSLIQLKELPNDQAINTTKLMKSDTKAGLANSLQKLGSAKPLTADDIKANREAVNEVLAKLSARAGQLPPVAQAARIAAISMHNSRCCRRLLFWGTTTVAALIFGVVSWKAWEDTYVVPGGEPFNFAGTSAWPTEFIRLAVFTCSLIVIWKTQRRLKYSIWELTRRYRFNLDPACTKPFGCLSVWRWLSWRHWKKSENWSWRVFLPDTPVVGARVEADVLWGDYQRTQGASARLGLVAAQVALYLLFGFSLMKFTGIPVAPIRGEFLCRWDFWLLILAVLALLLVTFWTIEVSRCCAWFISRLTQAATHYPDATVEYFKKQRAINDDSLVEEWIDLHLIADLTEPIGQLIYWPFFAAMLMLLARIHWLDNWSWPWPLLVILTLNLVLAAASSILLRQTASRARKIGLQNLEAKMNAKKRAVAKSLPEHEANQAELLLDEIKKLRRGAFAPVSQSPLVSALLMNSSGIVFIQVLALIFSK